MSTVKYIHRVTHASWRVAIAAAVAAALLAVGLMGFGGGGNAGAASVTPVKVEGNPTCLSLGYEFDFKPQPEPPPSGTYTFPDGVNTVTIVSDGTNVSWTSTLSVDAVIVKGSNAANVYEYDPESSGDSSLHSPTNASGNPAAISHINFCYDYEVNVTKSANTSYTRTYSWSIDKSVTPATWDLFTGDSGTSEYTVAVTKTGYSDSDWAVSGIISVSNPHPLAAATITGVTDEVGGFGVVAVDCGVAFPYALPAAGTLDCSYSTPLPDATSRTNTATVTTTGVVGGGSGSADIIFDGPTTVVNGSVDVDDTNGSSWWFDDSGSVTYSAPFTCDTDEGQHHNTAVIRQTGQNDSASVTVNCYDLAVTKNATTSFTRTWDWTIDKSADQSDLLLSDGQLFQVNYAVEVDATSSDSDFAVSGDIWVANPNPSSAANLTAVNDLISPAIAAAVDCPSLTVPAGGTLHCTYSAALPNDTARTNTATATLQNYAYAADGTGTASGTTDFTGTASVAFDLNNPDEMVDECIDVSDSNVGNLGTACAGDAPKTFTYSLVFGAHADADVVLECGNNTLGNVASFVTNDSGTTGSDNWTVHADVACLQGCTLTQGYWKTHSKYGPAPADDAWYNLGDVDGDGKSEGPDETFFFSGKTYYQVLWTPPAGNAYYNLAHQYIAAKLNIVNGASVPAEVQSAMAAAETLFASKIPAQVAALKGQAKSQVTSLAATLDAFNNGLIGPGHCDE